MKAVWGASPAKRGSYIVLRLLHRSGPALRLVPPSLVDTPTEAALRNLRPCFTAARPDWKRGLAFAEAWRSRELGGFATLNLHFRRGCFVYETLFGEVVFGVWLGAPRNRGREATRARNTIRSWSAGNRS